MTDHHFEANEVVIGGGSGFPPPMPPPMPPPAPGEIHTEAKRLQRLSEGVRNLRAGGGTLNLGERVLLILAGILAPTGLGMVLLAWYGASHTPNLFEQIPYLISGGLLGLGFVFLGSFFYFAHWLTELVKEHRAQSAAVVEAIGHLEEVIARTSTASSRNGGPVAPTALSRSSDVPLVATLKGTMAHRPECVVVAGKVGLREVTPADELVPCKLCDPYGVVAN